MPEEKAISSQLPTDSDSLDEKHIDTEEDIKSLADIEDCYFELMLKRIANNLREPTDYEVLSVALTGTNESAERLKKLHVVVNSKTKEEE